MSRLATSKLPFPLLIASELVKTHQGFPGVCRLLVNGLMHHARLHSCTFISVSRASSISEIVHTRQHRVPCRLQCRSQWYSVGYIGKVYRLQRRLQCSA